MANIIVRSFFVCMFTSQALATSTPEVESLAEPTIRIVDSRGVTPTQSPQSDQAIRDGIRAGPMEVIGDLLWKLVKGGRPVVKTKTAVAHVLPPNTDWREVTGWRGNASQVYKITYDTVFGIQVVDFDFRINYTYGGSHRGAGQYLANINVSTESADVYWGYDVNANAKIMGAINVGTVENPIAATEIHVHWTVQNFAHAYQKTSRFLIQGDGQLRELQ